MNFGLQRKLHEKHDTEDLGVRSKNFYRLTQKFTLPPSRLISGTVSLSAIYAALVLSCIFVPTFVIKRLTVKWTLCVSMMCYLPYIGFQFYPRFYTLVPAGILVGIGAAPMWAAKATYLTQVGAVYAKLTDQAVDAIIVRFFGFFFLAWQTAELWGNLISSLGKLNFGENISN